MTIMSNARAFPTENALPKAVDVSKEELRSFVNSGVIRKLDNHKEHFAIQPCWINDPGSGVLEEINNFVLGKWNKKLKSYVVAVHNIRNGDHSAGMNEDHRWLHVDITATYYTYAPEEGQVLRGEIKKIGNRAAICIVFDVFTATVFAQDETERSSWTVGDQLEFKIYSFTHRRKGPILRAKSLAEIHSQTNVDGEEMEEADMKYDPSSSRVESAVFENGVDQEELDNELSSSSKAKKKKKKRKKHDDDEVSETEGYGNDTEVSSFDLARVKLEPESPVKKKKKKKKSSD